MVKRKFYADRVWSILKKGRGTKASEIAAALGLTPYKVTKILGRMKAKGHAKMGKREARHTLWYAMGRKPELLWGTNPNSLKNLNMSREWTEKTLRMAMVARGLDPNKIHMDPKPPVVPARSSCLLADVWKMPPMSSSQAD